MRYKNKFYLNKNILIKGKNKLNKELSNKKNISEEFIKNKINNKMGLKIIDKKNYKQYIFIILKYLMFFCSFLILAKASVYQTFFPFCIGLFFGLIWCNQKLSILAILYASSMLIVNPSISTLISVSFTVSFILLVCIIHTKLKKQIKYPLFIFYMFFSQAGYIFSEIYYNSNILFSILNVPLTIIFALACIKIFEVILIRGFVYKLNVIEVISGLSFLCAFAIGLTNFNLWGFEIIKLFATLIVLLSAYIFNITTCLFVASVVGLSPIISVGDASLLAPFVIWALVVSAFKLKNRIFPVVALICVECCLGYFVGLYYNYSVLSLIPVVLGCLIFLAIPTTWLNKLMDFFKTTNNNLAMRNVVNRSRESLCRRLYNLSDVFDEMDFVFRSMVKSGLNQEDVKKILIAEIKEKICADCAEKNICHRACINQTEDVFNVLVSAGLQRGKTSLLDVPPYLTARCSRVSNLVGSVNQLCSQYKEYAGMVSNLDASRVLIAEQLTGISRIMKNLAVEVKNNISFDVARENLIINELSYNNIVCQDVVIYQQNIDVVDVTLVVRKQDTGKKKIEEIVSKICKNKMTVQNVVPSKRAGWNVLSLQTAPKYDVIFGTATCPKDGSKISGDCYSVIRIDNDKFLLALCDGMGSGEKAEKTSSLAIGLVENFYKAGFDNEIILSSINKLLSLNREEIFSALDICVVNMRHGTADFIKMGSPNSYIKHKSTITEIKGGALPLGIVQNMQPVIIKEIMVNGDMIFMFTDGITDSFETDEQLEDFLNNLEGLNPQMLAEDVLARAIENSRGARDDMTVIVAKIFEI